MSQQIKRWGQLTYDRCREILYQRKVNLRKLAPNTTLTRESHGYGEPYHYAIWYYGTRILAFYADGRIILNSGGHKTVTTKQRLSSLSGFHVHQSKGQWYIGEQPFEDGMDVGHPVTLETTLRRAANEGDTLAVLALRDLQEENR